MKFESAADPGPRAILSIQSLVSFGHVGASAATFPLQRLGFDVWTVPTVVLSNHRGYDSCEGRVAPAGEITALLQGIETLTELEGCAAILTGYLGAAETVRDVAGHVERLLLEHRGLKYCFDPVIGDTGSGLYVPEDQAQAMRERLLPLASIATPNLFELGYLTGASTASARETINAGSLLQAMGPKTVLVTSAPSEDPAMITTLLLHHRQVWQVSHPELPLKAKGAGDMMAALFLAHLLRGEKAEEALGLAAGTLFGIIDETAQAGRVELNIVGNQSEFLHPSYYFEPLRIE